MGLELTGSVGPTFFLLLVAAAVGLYIAAKYRTNEALKGAAAGWESNAKAQESRADQLAEDLTGVKLDLEHVRTELDDLRKRAPDLKALYELSNHNTTLNQRNSESLTVMATQIERLVAGIDATLAHVAKTN